MCIPFKIVNCSKLLPAFELHGEDQKKKKIQNREEKKRQTNNNKKSPTFQVPQDLLTKPACFQGSFGINEALTNIFAAGLVLMRTISREGPLCRTEFCLISGP